MAETSIANERLEVMRAIEKKQEEAAEAKRTVTSATHAQHCHRTASEMSKKTPLPPLHAAARARSTHCGSAARTALHWQRRRQVAHAAMRM